MRKKFEDLTRSEMRALTDEDISYYKQYSLAEKGIILPPEPGEPPVKPEIPDPTIDVYECRGILVEKEEEAKLLATLSTVCYEDQDYSIGSEYKYYLTEPKYGDRDTGIKRRKLHDKKILESITADLKAYKKAKSSWDSDNSEYNEARKKCTNEISYIVDIIANVDREHYYIEQAKIRYAELLVLAEENKQIAFNFFIKAYPTESTTEKLFNFYSDDDSEAENVTPLKPLDYKGFLNLVGVACDTPEKTNKK